MVKPNLCQYDGQSERKMLFEILARNLINKGYSIHKNALPDGLSQELWDLQKSIPSAEYQSAGIGRSIKLHVNARIRQDEISWIDDTSPAGIAWNFWSTSLQVFLNTQLYLGLFSFESHFSHYSSGGFYQKHQDAFVGQGNRILSLVTYLNKNWSNSDAGELVLFTGDDGNTPITVAPEFGTLVVFLSEKIPHEVMMTNCDRFSIAGWFRTRNLNATPIVPRE